MDDPEIVVPILRLMLKFGNALDKEFSDDQNEALDFVLSLVFNEIKSVGEISIFEDLQDGEINAEEARTKIDEVCDEIFTKIESKLSESEDVRHFFNSDDDRDRLESILIVFKDNIKPFILELIKIYGNEN